MGGSGAAGVGHGPLERYIFTGAGTVENPAGANPNLEKAENFSENFMTRNESIISKGNAELVFRAYTPKTEDGFKKLASDPNFTAIRTSTGIVTFMQAGAAKFYLHSAKGECASIARPRWVDGRMVAPEKPDAFQVNRPGTQQMAKAPSTVASFVKQGALHQVNLPGGGKGYKVSGKGPNKDKAWSALQEAGYSFRQEVHGSEVWMNEPTWQKLQRTV